MPKAQQIRESAHNLYLRLTIEKHLSEVSKTNPQIAEAIIGAARGHVSEAERVWIDHIEQVRRRMNASSEGLEITDYGAGLGDSKLSEDEMYRGRVIRRTVGEISTITSRTERTALLLFRLIRELKPQTCLELGTSVGISGCYQAAALKLNGAGKLITLEGADSVAKVAAQNFAVLGLDNVQVVRGRFQDTLAGVLAAMPKLDYGFVDGHHDEAATVRYFHSLLPVLNENSIVVLDDIQWSEGMRRAWQTIREDGTVGLSIDLGSIGLISIGNARPVQHLRLTF